MVTPSDELKQAAEKYARDLYKHSNSKKSELAIPYLAVLAGAAYQDPIARREERERILGLLRSESLRVNEPDPVRTGFEWADWLEEKLK